MKTTLVDGEKSGLRFPVLMRHNKTGFVVMFTDKSQGVVVYSNTDGRIVGELLHDWWGEDDESVWSKFGGIITLQND